MTGDRSATHCYQLYGVRLRSAWPFPFEVARTSARAEINLVSQTSSFFNAVRARAGLSDCGDWVVYHSLGDGTAYVRWTDTLEAVVSDDGRQIACRRLGSTPPEVLHGYLLGAVLSFALIRQGIEPLHATVVAVDGIAVALMGDCGYGKSSLAAAFLGGGHRLVTDDLLVVGTTSGGLVAHPGAPRIRLFPPMARRMLGSRVRGIRMNRYTPKLIVPLGAAQYHSRPVPLAGIYVLSPPRPRSRSAKPAVQQRRLSQRQACMELVRNTFNMAVTDGARLSRQLALAGDVVRLIPLKRLSYPRVPSMLTAARDVILADLGS
jgi:hypothetical protein